MKLRKLALATSLVAVGASVLMTGNAFAQAKEQFIPVLSYRTGPYAPTVCHGRTAMWTTSN